MLALSILAASPDLHERLHGHHSTSANAAHHGDASAGSQAADDEDGCVVTLFAQGAVLPLSYMALAFAGQMSRPLALARGNGVVPESPRYLLLPAHGPPLAPA